MEATFQLTDIVFLSLLLLAFASVPNLLNLKSSTLSGKSARGDQRQDYLRYIGRSHERLHRKNNVLAKEEDAIDCEHYRPLICIGEYISPQKVWLMISPFSQRCNTHSHCFLFCHLLFPKALPARFHPGAHRLELCAHQPSSENCYLPE
ncbi:hypothetical protein QBC36DRAFT_47703 [Triangularia setosa]|uniref:Uncharacterized protein n=1 Tax=Triangularia setosa TaxID=2587417 RepID=A0AAN6W302_9PEZI|nr:hypothetical protein QBC36DRAFT_47703 [Podospora setosa]